MFSSGRVVQGGHAPGQVSSLPTTRGDFPIGSNIDVKTLFLSRNFTEVLFLNELFLNYGRALL